MKTLPVGLVAVLLCIQPVLAQTAFDFSLGSGDRQVGFGSSNSPGNSTRFDNQSTQGFFLVQGGSLKFTTQTNTTSGWIVYDDAQPTTVNASRPSGYEQFHVGSSLVIRTQIGTLTSGAGGSAASAGILIGLSDNGSNDSGLLFSVKNTVAGSANDYLFLNSFTDGAVGGNLSSSSAFAYGASDAVYFLQLVLTPNGTSTNYTFQLIANSAIPGTGSDVNRLSDSAFNNPTVVSSIDGVLTSAQYSGGYAGLFFQNDINNTSGQVLYNNFYISTVPEPAISLLLPASLLCLYARSKFIGSKSVLRQ